MTSATHVAPLEQRDLVEQRVLALLDEVTGRAAASATPG